MTSKQLRAALVEVIEVCNLVDDGTQEPIQVDKKATEEEMIEMLKEAAAEITPKDKISDETMEIVNEVLGKKKDKKATKATKTPEPEPEVSESEELMTKIDSAESLKELKAIAAGNEIFKPSLKKLNVIKNVDDLREEMLNILEDTVIQVDETNDTPADVEEPVVEQPKKKTTTKTDAPKTDKADKTDKKESSKKGKGVERVGVIAAIVKEIEDAGKKGITKDAIVAKLVEKFPDRSEESMRNTVNVQVPARINKEKFAIERLQDGLYRKAGLK